jgi:hypothetical protein
MESKTRRDLWPLAESEEFEKEIIDVRNSQDPLF